MEKLRPLIRGTGLLLGLLAASPLTAGDAWLAGYQGGPFVPRSPQPIPGALKFAYYDTGGEGIAYHTGDPLNHGSGQLNPADGNPLNEFRLKEGVSISFTKGHDAIDLNPFDRIRPAVGSLYVGWTKPGEWLNYTVQVEQAGTYVLSLTYTANGNGRIGLAVDGDPVPTQLAIPGTDDPKEPVAWRQWHHWDRIRDGARIALPAGRHVLTVTILERGNMNLDTLDFRPAEPGR